MYITIGKPCAISEKGNRLHNEDYIYPSPEAISSGQRMFMVCDGLGGADSGEIAGSLASDHFRTFFTTMLGKSEPSCELIRKAVQYTEAHFDAYMKEHPDAGGMSSTLAMLYISSSGITLARVGNSRIYQFRKGDMVFSTKDKGLIDDTSPDASINSIRGSAGHAEVEEVLIADIQPGDYFFMCTDGIMEKISDEMLASIFRKQLSADIIKDELVVLCDGKTSDNYSFYIIPIQNVQDAKQNIRSFLYSII
ncbi:MAG: serine/threonine-protein phosphatase [Tannerellaceae bacterium]|jgi:protein phosphatase|nr:serine/threonine-protein phosphatase [Tannerellaceae bacterium]